MFKEIEEFNLSKGKELVVLPCLGKEYVILFELLLTEVTSWGSVIHFTIGGNKNNYGDRTPGLWVSKKRKFSLASAINGTSNNQFWPQDKLDLDKWYTIEISQSSDGSQVFYDTYIVIYFIYSSI